MLCARSVPRLVHLHRGPQGAAPAAPRRRPPAQRQRPRPLRHRLRALHVLRHLRRGVPVRRAVLEPRVRVLRAAHRRAAARQGQARRVDGDRSRARAPRARRRSRRARSSGRARTSPSGSSRRRWRSSAIGVVTTKNVVHAALFLVVVLAGGAGAVHPARPGVRRLGAGARLHRRGDRAVPVRDHAHARADASRRSRSTTTCGGRALVVVAVPRRHPRRAADRRVRRRRRSSSNAPTRTAEVTNSIFRTYIIPFEVVGVLLLGALIGAVVLARKD